MEAKQKSMDEINFKNLTDDLCQKKKGHSFQLFSINIYQRDILLSQETRSAIISNFKEMQDGYFKSSTTSSYTGDVEGMGAMHNMDIFEELIKEIEISVLDYLRSFSKMYDKLQVYHQKSWPVFLKSGTSVDSHHHSNSDLSAVYYFDVPEGSGGELIFYSPIDLGLPSNSKGVDFWKNEFCVNGIKPYTGLLVIFPSSIKHEVRRYTGEAQRVSFSFDFTLTASPDLGSGQIENLPPSINHWRAFHS